MFHEKKKTLAQEMVGKKRLLAVTRDKEENLKRMSEEGTCGAVAKQTFDDLRRQLAVAKKSAADSVCIAQGEKPAGEIERRAEKTLSRFLVEQLGL